jgi:hypothetical protein
MRTYQLLLPSHYPQGGSNRLKLVVAKSPDEAIDKAIQQVQDWPYWIAGCGYTSSKALLIHKERSEDKYFVTLLLDGRREETFHIYTPKEVGNG